LVNVSDRIIGGQLISNPLHVLQEHLLPAAVIKLGGSAVSMACDPLGRFKSPGIFQKIRDAGRSK